jgi:outer membrane protein OmpA-like peptidoglycan-associated protein
LLLLLVSTAAMAVPGIWGVRGLNRINSAIPMGFNQICFNFMASYWTAENTFTNFLYRSHTTGQEILFPEITDTEHLFRGVFSIGYGVWDYIDLGMKLNYFSSMYQRDLYEERSTGQWEELNALGNYGAMVKGGYNPLPGELSEVLWAGGAVWFEMAPSDSNYLSCDDDQDGRWFTGQRMSELRYPCACNSGAFGFDVIATGDFGYWVPTVPIRAHLNLGFASYSQDFNFWDFRSLETEDGWELADSTMVNLSVKDNVLSYGLGLEIPTPSADVLFEYKGYSFLDRTGESLSYITPGIRFKTSSGMFLDISYDMVGGSFDPLYHDLGHGLYQDTSLTVTESERAARAPLPIPGSYDWGVNLTLGFSGDLVRAGDQAPRLGTLNGTVTDSLTGAPVFATITFPGVPVSNVTSDQQTGFYVVHVPAGDLPVTVVAPGYRNASTRLTVQRNETQSFDFRLSPNLGTVSGAVRDGQGRAVAGATVTIGSTSPVSVTTNTAGVYSASVEGGTWPVTVQASGFLSDNQNVTLSSNATTTLNFTLRDALAQGQVMSFDNIYFDSGSANIKPESYPVLDSVAILLRDNPSARIQIAGHTDSDGSTSSNQSLSERRAQSVFQYLVSKGIQGSRLTTIGYGEDRPVVANDSAANKARNRRIEFTVLSI